MKQGKTSTVVSDHLGENDHPVRKARLEYATMLACPGLQTPAGHQMEDGDLCRHCRTPGDLLRIRARFDEERRLVESGAPSPPKTDDADCAPA